MLKSWRKTSDQICVSRRRGMVVKARMGIVTVPKRVGSTLTEVTVCMCAQSCLTLCNPVGCSSPGFSGIFRLPWDFLWDFHASMGFSWDFHRIFMGFPWDFPGKNTRVGCHFLLQGIFPKRGLNLVSPELQADSLPLSH